MGYGFEYRNDRIRAYGDVKIKIDYKALDGIDYVIHAATKIVSLLNIILLNVLKPIFLVQ